MPKISEEPFITSIADGENWAGLYAYKARDQRITMSKGGLYTMVSIKGPAGFPAQMAGKYIWEAIVDKFYFGSKGNSLKCLKDSVKAGRYRLISLLKNDEKFAEEGVDLGLISIVILDNLLYMAVIGDPLIYVVRDGKIVDLSKAFTGEDSKEIVNVGSGKLDKGDIVILAAPNVIDRIDALTDFAQDKGVEISWSFLVDWFKQESSLFDSNECVYLLGFNIKEKEKKLSGDIQGKEKVKAGIGISAEEMKTAGGLASKISIGIGAAVSKVKEEGYKGILLGITGFGKNVAAKVKNIGKKKRAVDKDRIEDEKKAETGDIGAEENGSKPETEDGKGEERKTDKVEDEERNHVPITDKKEIEQKNKQEIKQEDKQEDKVDLSGMSYHEREMYKATLKAKEKSTGIPAAEVVYEPEGGEETPRAGPLVTKKGKKEKFPSIRGGAVRGGKFNEFFRKAKAVISSLNILKKSKKYFVGKKENTLARYVIIGIIVVALGFFLIRRVLDNRRIAQLQQNYDTEISALDNKITDAENLLETDPSKAREELMKALDDADEITKIEIENNKGSEKVDYIQALLDDLEKKVGLSEENDNFEILLDAFAQYGDDANISDFALLKDVLYLTDPGNSSVYTFNVITKATGKISDPEEVLQEPKWIESSEAGNIFIYDKKQGMVKYEPKEGGLKTLTGLTPKLLGNVTEFSTFGQHENLYFLDSERAKIFRSQVVGAGYTAPEEYVLFGGFDKSNDIAVDGNIFVSTRTVNRIYKFFRGVQDRFDIKGLFDPLGVTAGIFIKPGYLNLYLIDQENKRVVVLETPDNDRHKGEAVLVKQYVYRGERKKIFEELIEIVVDSSKENAYLLENSKVYRIAL